jgi:uncharacterized protein with HEPN domain
MHPKSPKWLDDIARSCRFIDEDTVGMSLYDYLKSRVVRQAVERNLEIIGEAAIRLRSVDPVTAREITDIHQIIGLRNRLAHGYDDEVDDRIVWQCVQASVPVLRRETATLLAGLES